MNRREFVKAVAGILSGLLIRLLGEHGELKIAGYPDVGKYVTDKALFDAAYAELQLNTEDHPSYGLNVGNADEAGVGKAIFYDPFTDKGDDANDGLTRETPVATPERVLALCTAPRKDWIFTVYLDENGDCYRDLQVS